MSNTLKKEMNKLTPKNPLDFFGLKAKSKPASDFDHKTKPLLPNETKKINDNKIVDDTFFNSQKSKIKLKGTDLVPKISRFEDLSKLNSQILQNVKICNFVKPTIIQSFSIPFLLKKRDLFGIAPTGSGKTAAFLMPMLHFVAKYKAKNKCFRGLIITPTRELALQIQSDAIRFSKETGISISLADSANSENGSENFGDVDVIVSTPFALSKCAGKSKFFKSVRFLVLDEADRLLDFTNKFQKQKSQKRESITEQIDKILSFCDNKKLQKCLFSATLPAHVENLARTVLRNPVRLIIGKRDVSTTTVDQELMFVGKESSKMFALLQILGDKKLRPVLIFVQSKKRAKMLNDELNQESIRSEFIDSDRSKKMRDDLIKKFNGGELPVLVCTDLVARGIDFVSVALVLNYDFPTTATEYVHRVGRSGRAGKRGKAITFFTNSDRLLLRSIAEIIEQSGGQVPKWILETKRVSRTKRMRLRFKPPKRRKVRAIAKLK